METRRRRCKNFIHSLRQVPREQALSWGPGDIGMETSGSPSMSVGHRLPACMPTLLALSPHVSA